MKITPLDIQSQQFHLRFRGFDVQEVDSFLQAVAVELEEQMRENSALKKRIAELENVAVSKRTGLPPRAGEEGLRGEIEEEYTALVEKARIAAEEMLENANNELESLNGEIDRLKKFKAEYEAYFDSYLQFAFDMLQKWRDIRQTPEEPEEA